jgi:endonuclease/exonuclease/phosphatase family metal-dependent hydrolase
MRLTFTSINIKPMKLLHKSLPKPGWISFTAIFILLITWSGSNKRISPGIQTDAIQVRILSYNVRNCNGMDGVVDYARVADIIKRINPDVVALQELDSATVRSKGVVVLDELARLTGMYKTYGASIDYQGGKYGIGMLTKEKPVSWKRIPLPGSEEPRSLLIVEMEKIVVGCTHFSLTQEDRLASATIVSNAFKEYSKPVMLAGDLNAVPGSAVMNSIDAKWDFLTDISVPTVPSGRCIDYIMGLKSENRTFVTKKTVVEQEHVASDHLPVWADVEIK